jgi:hypothetical protein
MDIEKVTFANMIGKFQRVMSLAPPTASFAYAVERALEHYREGGSAVALERLGTHECEEFVRQCEAYLRELGESYNVTGGEAVQWKTGKPLTDPQWPNRKGEPMHWSQMQSEDWDALQALKEGGGDED